MLKIKKNLHKHQSNNSPKNLQKSQTNNTPAKVEKQDRLEPATKPGIDEARAGFLFFLLQPLLAFFFLLMVVARAKPGLHVNHGRRGG